MKNAEFVKVIEDQSSRLHEHALKFTRDIEDANDLVQETMIKAVRSGIPLKRALTIIRRAVIYR